MKEKAFGLSGKNFADKDLQTRNDVRFSSNSDSEIDLSRLKFLLWDIDGTLLQSTRPGGFRDYFSSALEKTFGTKGKIAEVSAAGATDTQIVFESLKGDGYTTEQISRRMNEFVKVLGAEMRNYVDRYENVYELLPGVKKILQATDSNPHFVNALLTGNVSCGAEIKCSYVGVWQYFEKSLNTYGDVSHDRRRLAVAAGRNFNTHYKAELKPEQFIIIGDTPFDIITAKNFGAKIVSVETGRGIKREALNTENPDVLISNLSDTEKVLRIFETL